MELTCISSSSLLFDLPQHLVMSAPPSPTMPSCSLTSSNFLVFDYLSSSLPSLRLCVFVCVSLLLSKIRVNDITVVVDTAYEDFYGSCFILYSLLFAT